MMNTRRAFTLVEILTVIVIISILVALVTLAVAGAMRSAKRARIGIEMSQIAMALEQYKGEFGEYPPDMFDDDVLVRHVKKRWPRYSVDVDVSIAAQDIRDAISTVYSDLSGKTIDFTSANSYASLGALALWLGGFPNADGKLSGFGADPEHPFTVSNGAFDGKAFLDWEIGDNKNVRFIDLGGGVVPVIGNEIQDTFVPIVYFRGRADGGEDAYKIDGDVKHFSFSEFGLCVPYAERLNNDDTVRWYNPTTYQLIHPGLDSKFGVGDKDTIRVVNSGDGIGVQDLDNLTNFSDYKELKSILP